MLRKPPSTNENPTLRGKSPSIGLWVFELLYCTKQVEAAVVWATDSVTSFQHVYPFIDAKHNRKNTKVICSLGFMGNVVLTYLGKR